MAYASAIMIAIIGITALTGLTFRPHAESQQVAVIVAPWGDTGLQQIAETGLAIVDTHWRRHVWVLDTRGDPNAITALRDRGFWVVDATGTSFCGPDLDRSAT